MKREKIISAIAYFMANLGVELRVHGSTSVRSERPVREAHLGYSCISPRIICASRIFHDYFSTLSCCLNRSLILGSLCSMQFSRIASFFWSSKCSLRSTG